jgi:hypothetical protein
MQQVSCKAQWVSIAFQLFQNLLLMFFRIFSGRRRFGKNWKVNALKAARPEVAADTDTMEFMLEEETTHRFLIK